MARVHIAIPSHSDAVSVATMRSVHDAVFESQDHDVTFQCMGLSLLARNFNSLWSQAYRSGYDYFILHHSDLGVAAPRYGQSWVDLLIYRLRELNAAVLSVAAPIKSVRGHFSMGLDLKEGNPYTLRRVTARELFMLPDTFIARVDLCRIFGIHPDVAGAMIINTGLFCMDLRRFPWGQLRWPGFNIVDSIQWSLDGVPMAFTEPEDWFASRWMHKYELPFYATKELILDHHGHHVFYNQGLWGDPQDDTTLQPSMEQWQGAYGRQNR